jgi:hypothetical protein
MPALNVNPSLVAIDLQSSLKPYFVPSMLAQNLKQYFFEIDLEPSPEPYFEPSIPVLNVNTS